MRLFLTLKECRLRKIFQTESEIFSLMAPTKQQDEYEYVFVMSTSGANILSLHLPMTQEDVGRYK